MFDSTGFEIAEYLSDMLISKCPSGFQLYNQASVNKQNRHIVADFSAVFVVNFKRVLLFYVETKFAKPMGQSIFINLVHAPIRMVNVNIISRLPHDIA